MLLRLLLAFWIGVLSFHARAEEPKPVYPQGQAFELPHTFTLVDDHAGMLPPSLKIRLIRKLDALNQKNGTRIVLITVPSTGSEGLDAYSARAFMNTGLGEGSGNGVLFMIDASNGQFYIRTGAGIGGAMPDSWIRQLIDKTITPLWTPENHLKGLEAGVDALIARAGGEETKPSTFDKVVFEQGWKVLSWGSLGVVLIIYVAGCLAWHFGLRRKLPGFRSHAVAACVLGLIAVGIALYPDPLDDLLQSRRTTPGKGDFLTPKLPRQPSSLATLASPGRTSIIVITYEKLASESSLENQLRDLAKLRPDISVRMAFLDFEDWNTGELRQLFGQEMAILPYFMIYGPDGSLIAADKGNRQDAADLLSRWHAKEAYREAGITP